MIPGLEGLEEGLAPSSSSSAPLEKGPSINISPSSISSHTPPIWRKWSSPPLKERRKIIYTNIIHFNLNTCVFFSFSEKPQHSEGKQNTPQEENRNFKAHLTLKLPEESPEDFLILMCQSWECFRDGKQDFSPTQLIVRWMIPSDQSLMQLWRLQLCRRICQSLLTEVNKQNLCADRGRAVTLHVKDPLHVEGEMTEPQIICFRTRGRHSFTNR